MKIITAIISLIITSLTFSQSVDSAIVDISIDLKANEIIEKYIEAIGGREKLELVENKTMKLKSSVEGMNLTLTIIQAKPNKLFQELEFTVGKQTTVFDGEKGKIEGMNQIQFLEGEKLEDLKYLSKLNAFLDYEANGVKVEYAGTDSLNDKIVNKIILTSPNGKIFTDYYDVETGLKIREESNINTPQGSYKQKIDLEDYKLTDGILNPFKLTQKIADKEVELIVESIEYNSDLNDAIFNIE
ncbi:MAG: hypothetical protein KDC88_07340 [Ignavibacteriae bacterium]|nr:hypothetical protein [Ignavibacteriota bacterium]MCB9207192.1 hypothetical protein [Ignavibacteriales bacterium]MCB9210321.1 hypothetical protein [Ignavibacteriales bacterium]MCB9219126.1 hypothetical protein [Ignavibacteriales bacterium]MCB9259708.1 hypothetical protein [Ignavibacteriales bacterium]